MSIGISVDGQVMLIVDLWMEADSVIMKDI